MWTSITPTSNQEPLLTFLCSASCQKYILVWWSKMLIWVSLNSLNSSSCSLTQVSLYHIHFAYRGSTLWFIAMNSHKFTIFKFSISSHKFTIFKFRISQVSMNHVNFAYRGAIFWSIVTSYHIFTIYIQVQHKSSFNEISPTEVTFSDPLWWVTTNSLYSS